MAQSLPASLPDSRSSSPSGQNATYFAWSFETARRSDRRDLCRLRHRPHHPWHRRRRTIVRSAPSALQSFAGRVAYLSLFAVRSFWRALRPGASSVASATTDDQRRRDDHVGVHFLNPHVYLDTVSCSDRLAINTDEGVGCSPRASMSSLMWFRASATERDSRLV